MHSISSAFDHGNTRAKVIFKLYAKEDKVIWEIMDPSHDSGRRGSGIDAVLITSGVLQLGSNEQNDSTHVEFRALYRIYVNVTGIR